MGLGASRELEKLPEIRAVLVARFVSNELFLLRVLVYAYQSFYFLIPLCYRNQFEKNKNKKTGNQEKKIEFARTPFFTPSTGQFRLFC